MEELVPTDAGWNTTGTNKFAFTITSSKIIVMVRQKMKTGSGSTPIFTNFTKLIFGGILLGIKLIQDRKKVI